MPHLPQGLALASTVQKKKSITAANIFHLTLCLGVNCEDGIFFSDCIIIMYQVNCSSAAAPR